MPAFNAPSPEAASQFINLIWDFRVVSLVVFPR